MIRTIAITGATGYLGRALSTTFLSSGWRVIALSRRKPLIQEVEWYKWSLGDKLPDGALAGVQCVIHCAYDFNARSPQEARRVNVEGSRQLFEQLTPGTRLILISSIAAQPGTKQIYGRQKQEIEQLALEHKGVALRPGLIIGDPLGGILRRIASLPPSPILPLPASGAIQYLTSIDVLCNNILTLASASDWEPKILTIVSEGPMPMNVLARRLRPSTKIVLRVPWRPLWFALMALERMGMGLSLSADSLYGLATTRYTESVSLQKE